jgi:steroid delta-isomerase-like uncharacterized protein
MDVKNYAKAAQTAFNARDLDALAALWAEDMTYLGPDGEMVTGKDHSVEREKALWAGVPDIQVELTCFAADGDNGVMQGRMTGTHTGTLSTADGTFPPSGRPLSIEFVALFTFKDGLAASERVYYDRVQLAAQLGAA